MDKRARQRSYQNKFYKNNSRYYIDKAQARKVRITKKFAAYKSTVKCSQCQENHPACLDFHHSNGDKEIGVCDAVDRGWGWDRILMEIAKCVVLCSNCHRKLHYNERIATPTEVEP